MVARVDNDVMGFQFYAGLLGRVPNPHSEEGMWAYRASLVFLFVRAALESCRTALSISSTL